MKVIRHHGGARRQALWTEFPEAPPAPRASEKRYLVWGILRLVLGMVQMTFAAAAILNLTFDGLSAAVLTYAGVATIATVVSRLVFRGRNSPPP